ncbi:LacI family DNA-binding transcriptional regulator [Streptomyces boninensis]|uniref:LacI family DNA-binding transcriptional regulator n=1 Tax=Streptomyces boninensis TaxID=2039455 RepID=UPI003B21EDB2
MARPPTLEDVARAAGVSRATASRVLNGTRNVDPELQEAVRSAVASTGYVPNSAARSLVTRRTGAVALVISGAGDEGDDTDGDGEGAYRRQVLSDPFFGRVVDGAIGALRPYGMHPLLMLAESAEARAEVVDRLRQGMADGALLVSTHGEDLLPGMLTSAGVPTVLFARPARPVPASYVDLAHRDGARLAAEHLIARGCERVATISGPLDVLAGQERFAGLREAMERRGHPYLPCAEGNFTRESGEEAMTRLLREHPDLDGVFAANDLMAQGALHVLQQHGKHIPTDVAVIGFDDSSAATATRPTLTTIRQPVEDMAGEMVRMLVAALDAPAARPSSVIFEPSLVVRESA